MTIKLYKCFDQKNKLNKTLLDEKIIIGTLKNKVSIINPVIVLNSIDFTFTDYNYCYIVEFDRYFFIENININSLQLFEIVLSIDVLMSYKDKLRQCEIEIEKTDFSNVANKTITETQTENNENIIEYEVANIFDYNNNTMYLTGIN